MKYANVLAAVGIAWAAAGCAKKEPEGPPPLAITVHDTGYEPSSVNAPAGQPARLVFTRTSDDGCGQQLVFPDLDIRRDLPLNKAVTVDITMPASGTVKFTCGMDHWRGSVVAQ